MLDGRGAFGDVDGVGEVVDQPPDVVARYCGAMGEVGEVLPLGLVAVGRVRAEAVLTVGGAQRGVGGAGSYVGGGEVQDELFSPDRLAEWINHGAPAGFPGLTGPRPTG